MKTVIPECTVGYVLFGAQGNEQVLLGEKAATEKAVRRGIAGKRIGYGGDIEETDSDPVAGFIRELIDESGDEEAHLTVDPRDVELMAKIEVRNEVRPSLILYYLIARNVSGSAKATREILDPRLFPTRALPDNILEADKIILPRIFEREKLAGWLLYNKDMHVISYDLTPVDEIK